MRISLDTSLSPLGATIVTDGHAAWFDLAGLPRVDAQLVGRPAASVPPLVERLCGICPVPHHLAGLAALEALTGTGPLPDAARATRRLLLYASTVDQLALRLAQVDLAAVRPLRQAAKAAMTAAGSPGHFPTTGVSGGVRALPATEALAEAAQAAQAALPVAEHLIQAAGDLMPAQAPVSAPDAGAVPAEHGRAVPQPAPSHGGTLAASCTQSRGATWATRSLALPFYSGLEVCLVDEDGHPDLMGPYLRAVNAPGQVVLDRATPEQWHQLVTESRPGAVAPRPLLHLPGDPVGHPGHPYRVGPLAQLAVGPLPTPRAAAWQERWLDRARQEQPGTEVAMGAGSTAAADAIGPTSPVSPARPASPAAACSPTARAAQARAIMLLHALEVVADLTSRPGLFAGEADSAGATGSAPTGTSPRSATSTGTGWVESPRGLLVHSYTAGPDGTLKAAQILTPTVQTEPWLADMLTSLAPALGQASAEASLPEEVRCAVEQAVQAADPCLPCVSAPAGSMAVSIRCP